MKAMERLHKAYRKERESFVSACYRELLGREPDPGGLSHHTQLLKGGKSKLFIMVSLMQCPEAEQLYRSGGAGHSGKLFADMLRNAYSSSDERFVQRMYEEILCRRADPQGLSKNVEQLKRGVPRAVIAAQLLQSSEAVELLKAKTSIPIAQKVLFDFAARTFMPHYNY